MAPRPEKVREERAASKKRQVAQIVAQDVAADLAGQAAAKSGKRPRRAEQQGQQQQKVVGVASAAALEPARRSGRPRREVDYSELKEAVEARAAAALAPASVLEPLPPYDPPASATAAIHPSFDPLEGKRDRQGRLVFPDQPDFRPNLTPKQVIQAGSFGGIYFNPRGGKPGIKGASVAIDPADHPADWFEGLPAKAYRARIYTKSTNKYGVKAGQDQAFWEGKGWINAQDPRGWFHWYCRFYTGRRTQDDARQISRWKGVVGDKGRWVRALVNKVIRSNKRFDDASVSPVIRQTLLHWAFELTEDEFERMRGHL